ncbi:MAG: FHA domain-containing protein [Phycisphaera sp.]|nr:FHA domain-containing protein [Phycisphaera sp.]
MKASLVMIKADGDRRDFPLKKAITIIGRMHTCDLRIPLSSISREHCQIERRDDGLYLRDLGSSNGTYHNDRRIMESKLDAGDTINAGPVNFTVVINGEPEEFAGVASEMPGGEEVQTREEVEAAAEAAAAAKAKAEAKKPAPAATEQPTIVASPTAVAEDDSDEVDIHSDEDLEDLAESADQTPVDLDVAIDDEPVSGMEVLAELEDDEMGGVADSRDATIQEEDDRPGEPDDIVAEMEESNTLEPILEPSDNGDDEEDEDAMLDKLSAMDSAEIKDPRSLQELRDEEPEPITEDFDDDEPIRHAEDPFGDDPISALDALSAMEGGGGGESNPEDALSWMDDEDD